MYEYGSDDDFSRREREREREGENIVYRYTEREKCKQIDAYRLNSTHTVATS